MLDKSIAEEAQKTTAEFIAIYCIRALQGNITITKTYPTIQPSRDTEFAVSIDNAHNGILPIKKNIRENIMPSDRRTSRETQTHLKRKKIHKSFRHVNVNSSTDEGPCNVSI